MASVDSVGPVLLTGEKIIWSGRPRQGLMFGPRDVFLVPFSLMWGGFAIFWETSVLNSKTPAFFALWGVPFVLLGLFFIFGRFLADVWVRNGTTYAVTNRRILIIRTGAFKKLITLSLDRLPEIELSEKADGSGTIMFGGGNRPIWSQRGFGSWIPSLDSSVTFIGIEDVRRVFDTIQKLTLSKS